MAVTLGVGMDIYPHTVPEAAFTVLVSAVGVFMFAFVVGSATSSLATKDAMALHQRNRVETIQHYMRYRRVPMKLQRQVSNTIVSAAIVSIAKTSIAKTSIAAYRLS